MYSELPQDGKEFRAFSFNESEPRATENMIEFLGKFCNCYPIKKVFFTLFLGLV